MVTAPSGLKEGVAGARGVVQTVPAPGQSPGVREYETSRRPGVIDMGNRPLSYAVVDAFLLLDLCGEDEFDPATTAGAMAGLRAQLTSLRHDDQVELRAQLDDIAADAADETYRWVVAGIADRVGLAYPRPGEHLSWR